MSLRQEHYQCHFYSNGAGPDLHAIGATDHLICDSPHGAWAKGKAFMNKHKASSVIASFAYELKDDIETLSSDNPAFIPYPSLVLFVPELLVTWELGELEVIESNGGVTLDAALVQELNALHANPEAKAQHTKTVSLDKDEYLSQVESLLKHIQAGDIYEANFCHEFKTEDLDIDPWNTFSSLQNATKAPYSCHLRIGDKHLLCGSPELFLEKVGQTVRSRPIKGTRPRSEDPNEDARLKSELQRDLKERAENIMICDLVRNDLTRSALPNSVVVTELCEVYSFETVHQMISCIESQVAEDEDVMDIIRSAFPMGSMTGAPKIRAMELIESHENFRRGIYSGSIGLFTPKRDFTLNVVIRSILYDAELKRASIAAGGAITALSEPEAEYEETLLKAKAMMNSLGL